MLSIYEDIILKIAEKMVDREKIRFTMTSREMDKLKYKLKYTEQIHIKKIERLSYFYNFEHVQVQLRYIMSPTYSGKITREQSLGLKILKHTKYVHYTLHPFAQQQFINKTRCNDLHQITHLTFHDTYNYSIRDIIPESVTHLKFGEEFNQIIEGSLPESITHLIFGTYFNRSIKKSIPSSVTHLTFGFNFQRSINKVPAFIQQINLSRNYNKVIHQHILEKVKLIDY